MMKRRRRRRMKRMMNRRRVRRAAEGLLGEPLQLLEFSPESPSPCGPLTA